MNEYAIWAAAISAAGVIVSAILGAIISYLANRALKTEVDARLQAQAAAYASELKTHEARLRIYSEMHLKLRERMLDGLADALVAITDAEDRAQDFLDASGTAAQDDLTSQLRDDGSQPRYEAAYSEAYIALRSARAALYRCPAHWGEKGEEVLGKLAGDVASVRLMGRYTREPVAALKASLFTLRCEATKWRREAWKAYDLPSSTEDR